MELLEGGPLGRLITGVGIAEDRSSRWIADVLSALSYMHGRRPTLYHRDVKPENVLLQTSAPDSPAKLVDLGLACIIERTSGLSTTRSAAGSLAYMSPEKLT